MITLAEVIGFKQPKERPFLFIQPDQLKSKQTEEETGHVFIVVGQTKAAISGPKGKDS